LVEDLMQSRSRPLRTAAAWLAACLFLVPACKADPNTHSIFTAVAPATPDAAPPPPPPPTDGGDTGGTSNADAGMTSGCGMDPNQAPGNYVQYHLSVAGPDKTRDRIYYVRLPASYDQTVPYRVVYIGPGCGGSTAADVLRFQQTAPEDAIYVAMMPLAEFGNCFDETMNSVEFPFFDALHKQIESSYCVDPARQFYSGFSTGARLAYMLDCAFPDVLRAVGAIQGVQPPLPACKSNHAGLFIIADTMETGNPYMGNVTAAQRLFGQNGCTGTFVSPMPPAGCGAACMTYDTMAMTAAPPTTTCVQYKGCPADGPIVFCSTIGQGHKTFEPWSVQAFWNFFKAF
jgi:poly(3-hydroxybutyrate) depolymerase